MFNITAFSCMYSVRTEIYLRGRCSPFTSDIALPTLNHFSLSEVGIIGGHPFQSLMRTGYPPYVWPPMPGFFLPYLKRSELPSPDIADRSFTNEKIKAGKLSAHYLSPN